MTPIAFVAIEPDKVGYITRRQNTNRRDQILCLRPPPIFRLDMPSALALVVNRRRDAGIELNVPAQVKLIRYIIQVALVFRLAGKMLFPVPFLQEFFRERVPIGVALGVETAARVAVPIPGAAYSTAVLKDLY